MRSIELGKVGKKIREIRKGRGMNLQEVATKSDITAGLLSRIENFRTLPSLPVLHKISIALAVPLSDLVEEVGHPGDAKYTLIKSGTGETEVREDSVGLTYENILNTSFQSSNLQVSIVRIDKGIYRPPVANDSMELVYVVNGEIEYGLDEDYVTIETGDTFYFDGSIPHSLKNVGDETGILLKVYLLRLK
ncbi:MAG: XRE family transcriptional regulator [Bacteroidota bacterium]